MVLQLDLMPRPILELLYLRRAWRIAVDIDLPGLDPLPEIGASTLPDAADRFLWEVRWKKKWKQAWSAQTAGQYRVPGTDILACGTGHVQEQEDWTSEFGRAGFDGAALTRWEQKILGTYERESLRAAHQEQVEPVIIAAWERGLEQVTALPWVGFVSQRLGGSQLVTSLSTLNDAQRFRTALAQWIKDSPQ
ncbi:hypothetical protein [Glutamicibacter sp.]|uniref:hypothetical protein n=1 Tax=Glutamicibacter sp. TaxID=1931995 RepID=UPI0028BD6AB0|nr:hypothetical protein [Glutamicibacter sp.]